MLTTLKSGFFLGIDSSGSTSEAVISDESGFVLGRGKAAGSNPHDTSVATTYAMIEAAVKNAQADVRKKYPKKEPDHFMAAGIGMAGLDTAADRDRLRKFVFGLPAEHQLNARQIVLVNNGYIGLKAGTEKDWGICIIASVGSTCYAIDPSGKEAMAGGWGYILGDQGSGYAIGRAILRQVMREYDGRTVRTLLTDKVLAYLNFETPESIVDWVYAQDMTPVPEIAELSLLSGDASLADNIELSTIMQDAEKALIQAFEATMHRCAFPDKQEIPVVLIGELFTKCPRYTDVLTRGILNRIPQASVVFPRRSAAEGAIRLAQNANAGVLVSESATMVITPQR